VDDADAYRRDSRDRWNTAAAGWSAAGEAMSRITMPVSAWMIEAIAPQPGHHVLELAAGTGEVGFLAAELIRPGGELICSDFSPGMLSAAQERATAMGLDNVRFKQIDAESIDLEAASLDSVLCRWGYMLMADPNAALRETRRVLKPGGSVALAVWTTPDENPWNTAIGRELVARGRLERPDPAEPGPFTWGEEGILAEHLEEAGFVDYEVEALAFAFTYPSAGAWWDATVQLSGRVSGALEGLEPAEVDEIRAATAQAAQPWTAEDGSVAIPARVWVARATA
jgi:SAM-dependent methyltransferase